MASVFRNYNGHSTTSRRSTSCLCGCSVATTEASAVAATKAEVVITTVAVTTTLLSSAHWVLSDVTDIHGQTNQTNRRERALVGRLRFEERTKHVSAMTATIDIATTVAATTTSGNGE